MISELQLDDTRAFPGTTRRVWVHTAAVHRSDEPAAGMRPSPLPGCAPTGSDG